jgi:hypothetical protein
VKSYGDSSCVNARLSMVIVCITADCNRDCRMTPSAGAGASDAGASDAGASQASAAFLLLCLSSRLF